MTVNPFSHNFLDTRPWKLFSRSSQQGSRRHKHHKNPPKPTLLWLVDVSIPAPLFAPNSLIAGSLPFDIHRLQRGPHFWHKALQKDLIVLSRCGSMREQKEELEAIWGIVSWYEDKTLDTLQKKCRSYHRESEKRKTRKSALCWASSPSHNEDR